MGGGGGRYICRGRGRLTGCGVHAPVDSSFVAAAGGAEGLVAGGKGDDQEEGDDEGRRGADMPLAEDDAEVGGVPGEEHLERDEFSW